MQIKASKDFGIPKTGAAIAIIGFVAVLLAVLMIGRSTPPGLAVGLQQLNRPAGPPVMAQLTLTNSGSRIMFLRCDAAQIRAGRGWQPWNEDAQDFCLSPGGVTNVTVLLPDTVTAFRVPFVWGWAKRGSAFQSIAPRLHTRFSNLMTTLRNSMSFRGWNDPYGYLPDGTKYYYYTNAESL